MKSKSRYCNNPAPSGGGKDCEGSSSSSRSCPNYQDCSPSNNSSNHAQNSVTLDTNFQRVRIAITMMLWITQQRYLEITLQLIIVRLGARIVVMA